MAPIPKTSCWSPEVDENGDAVVVILADVPLGREDGASLPSVEEARMDLHGAHNNDDNNRAIDKLHPCKGGCNKLKLAFYVGVAFVVVAIGSLIGGSTNNNAPSDGQQQPQVDSAAGMWNLPIHDNNSNNNDIPAPSQQSQSSSSSTTSSSSSSATATTTENEQDEEEEEESQDEEEERSEDSSSSSAATNDEGYATGEEPRKSDMESVMSYLIQAGVVSSEESAAFDDISSPQYKAVKWLANTDGMNLPVPSSVGGRRRLQEQQPVIDGAAGMTSLPVHDATNTAATATTTTVNDYTVAPPPEKDEGEDQQQQQQQPVIDGAAGMISLPVHDATSRANNDAPAAEGGEDDQQQPVIDGAAGMISLPVHDSTTTDNDIDNVPQAEQQPPQQQQQIDGAAGMTSLPVYDTSAIGNNNEPAVEEQQPNQQIDSAAGMTSLPVHGDTADTNHAKTNSEEEYQYITRYVMAVLYYSTGGSQWTKQYQFLSSRDVCTWNDVVEVTVSNRSMQQPKLTVAELATDTIPVGIYCDDETNRISSIRLNFNNLRGTLPSELGSLTSLKLLSMEGNDQIAGTFPEDLCKLSKLEVLGIRHNNIDGALPPCISSSLPQLRALLVSGNRFSGKVPDLSPLQNMESVLLDDNEFSGNNVATMFNQMPTLRHLYLGNNNFDGNLDNNFVTGAKASLEEIGIPGNAFTGLFPEHLLSFPKLSILDIHDNMIQGTFPVEIPVNNVLRLFTFHENQIEGHIPATISKLMNLEHFDASNNALNGLMQPNIGDMAQLQYLFLSNNNFDKGVVPDKFYKLTKLRGLSLKSTNRNGSLPDWLSTFSQLVLLDLGDNSFMGNIPQSWGQKLTDLQYLLLNRNPGITGEVPETFNQLVNLKTAFFESTDIFGSFEPLCTLPAFADIMGKENEAMGSDMNYVLSAECGGDARKVYCPCCDLCCENSVSSLDSTTCKPNTNVASIKPEWESGFSRVNVAFGE